MNQSWIAEARRKLSQAQSVLYLITAYSKQLNWSDDRLFCYITQSNPEMIKTLIKADLESATVVTLRKLGQHFSIPNTHRLHRDALIAEILKVNQDAIEL